MAQPSLTSALMVSIGKVLFDLRQGKKLKQLNVASVAQIDESVISRIEHGNYHSLNFRMLEKLARYYGVSVEEILSRSLKTQ